MPWVPRLEYFSALAPAIRTVYSRPRRSGEAAAAALSLLLCAGLFLSLMSTPCSAGGAREGWPGGAARAATLRETMRITDGDSAAAAILRAVRAEPDDPHAAGALMRAGYLAYVKGDAARAHELFGMADDAGSEEAKMWDGLALLSMGRIGAAAEALRRFAAVAGGGGAGPASLALAACDLAAGDLQKGETACRRIMDSGGECSAAASLLLRRSVPGAAAGEEYDRWADLVMKRRPLSYGAVLAGRLSRMGGAREAEGRGVTKEKMEGGAAALEGEPGRGTASGGASEGGAQARGLERKTAEGVRSDRAHLSDRPREYSVQVGAFSDVRNAESLLQNLVQKGYEDVRIETETRKGTLFHCVRVGRFSAREKAVSEASRIKASEGLGTAILGKEPG